MAAASAPAASPDAPAERRGVHEHPPLRRRPEEALIGGVCAGLARRLQVRPTPVRVLAAMSAGVGGIGLALYALAWALIPVDPGSEGARRPPGARRQAALIVLIVVGLTWAMRSLGLGLEQEIAWPAILGACGLALVWRPTVRGPRPDGGRRPSTVRAHLRSAARPDAPGVVLGAILVAFATASLLRHFEVLRTLGKAIGAVTIVMAIVAMLIVPWFVRLARGLSSERAARIREQERAEVAAHLHDSVLQTLALIQKRADDPREVAGLARRQERELRSWLLQRPSDPGSDTVASALESAAAEIEELHGVPIEVVTVGDRPLDARLGALVLAAREAMTNAAKFAGSERVDLFAEVQQERVEVFVRDRGIGFDATAVPGDRRGLRDSIIGRMERHRGLATVRSRPGEGTEVELQMALGATA